jgi:PhnB protein
MPASKMPPDFPVPEDRMDWVMHSEVTIGDGGQLFGSDNIAGTADPMAGAAVMLSLPTKFEAKAIRDRLVDGGRAEMPFAATFRSAGFGTLVDRHDERWMIGTDEAP